ncbi:MAG: class I SAM-dependent methyltransferase [Bacteroidia bacterium]|nr:class I SAM-dependent methyltransferase [Bacteroidia bacterium]
MSELLSACPVCHATVFRPFLEVEDFTVSHEKFELVECVSCSLVFTNPRPSAEEIGKYYQSSEYISHTNSSKGLMNKAYQWARRRAIAGKLKVLESLDPQPRTLLDYGCGTGEFLAAAKSKGWVCAGLELDEGARNLARKNHSINVDEPKHLKSLPSGQFGAITLWHVLEHVHELQETVSQLRRCLSSKGVLIIAVPNRTSYDAVKYGRHWAAYDVPRHLYHFSRKPMQQLMENAGFTCHSIQPLFFDPFYIALLSGKYKSGSSNPLTAAFTGWQTTIKGKSDLEKNSSLLYLFTPRS